MVTRKFVVAAIVLITIALPVQLAAFRQGGESVESILAVGLARMNSRDFQGAALNFRRAVQASPDSASAHYNLALALLALDENAQAAAEFKRVTVLAPQIAPAHYNLALLLEQTGDLPHAIEQLLVFRALAPGDAAGTVHLVYNYFHTGAAAEALRLARETLSQSADLRLQAQLGVVLLQNGHPQDAVQPLEAVVRSAPNSLSVIPYLARAYVETGRPAEAEDLLRHAIQLNPDNSGFRFSLGRLLLASSSSENRQQGVDEIKAAIRLSPQTPEYYEVLGRALLEKNQLEHAASVLKQGIDRVPASVSLNLMLGIAEADLHGSAAAKPYIDKALVLDPRAALAYNVRGNLFLRTGMYDEAVTNYKKAADLAPENDLYVYDVALALERMNKLVEALPYAQKAVALKTDRGITHYMLGKVYVKLDRNADAVRELEACIRLDPSAEPAYYLLARIYRKLSDDPKARQYATRLNELKAIRDSRVGLSGPTTAFTTLLDIPKPWDNTP